MHLLFVVDDVFAIKERGVIVLGKLADPERARFFIGDSVEIRRLGGSVINTSITGIPMGMLKSGMAEIALSSIDKSSVQAGDEVWLTEDRA